MTKYVAKVDVPPGIKKGDVVDFKEPLVASYKDKFEKYDGTSDLATDEVEVELDEEPKTLITNPDRNDLKARATELNINFAPNIPTDRLVELVQEAELKAKEAELRAAEEQSEQEATDLQTPGGDGDEE